jgi:hypothetical protein
VEVGVLGAAVVTAKLGPIEGQVVEELFERLERLPVAMLPEEDPTDLGRRAEERGVAVLELSKHGDAFVDAPQPNARARQPDRSLVVLRLVLEALGQKAFEPDEIPRSAHPLPESRVEDDSDRGVEVERPAPRSDGPLRTSLTERKIAERQVRLRAPTILRKRASKGAPSVVLPSLLETRAAVPGPEVREYLGCAGVGSSDLASDSDSVFPRARVHPDALELGQRLEISGVDLQQILERRRGTLKEPSDAEVEREPQERFAPDVLRELGSKEQVLVDLNGAPDVPPRPKQVREREVDVDGAGIVARRLCQCMLRSREVARQHQVQCSP